MQKMQNSASSSHPYPGLVSIHDITPETLSEAMDIIDFLDSLRVFPAALFIVPGVAWSVDELKKIKELQDAGYELVCHGWKHQCLEKKTIMHQLHGAIFSRNAAEHLSLSSEEIAGIIARGFQWFQKVGLGNPRFYAPPAWARGRIALKTLNELPFKMYEFLTAFYQCHTRSFYHLPLVGYEADTRRRVPGLYLMNKLNLGLAYCSKRPLRIAIHPYDLKLKLAHNLKTLLKRQEYYIGYEELINGAYAHQ